MFKNLNDFSLFFNCLLTVIVTVERGFICFF